MAEYIERETAVDAVSEVYYDTPDVNLSAEKFKAAINAIPAADVVEVVRCKDCKHYDMGVCLKIYSDGNVHAAAWQKRKPDDFCSYGERRDKQGCPRGQRGPLVVCPVCGGFDTSWNPDTDESFCKSCGFRTGKDGGNAEG